MQVITKVGSPVDITYQAVQLTSGLTDVVAKIRDETRELDGVNFPDVTLVELGATGRYYGSFTPDAKGAWTVTVDSATKPGPVVHSYIVTDQDLDSIGNAVAALNNLSAAEVDTALADYDASTKAELDGAEANLLSAIDEVSVGAMLG